MRKTKIAVLSSVMAAGCMMLPAYGDTTPSFTADHNLNPNFWNDTVNRNASLGPVERSNRLMGYDVKNPQNDKLGKIDDLAIEMPSGRVVEVIMGSGGFLGVGEKHFAIPPSALQFNEGNRVAILNMDKDHIKSAPQFDLDKWSVSTQPQQIADVYRYYGQGTYVLPADQIVNSPTAVKSQHWGIKNGANWDQRTMNNWSERQLGEIVRASKLNNLPVRNTQLEKIGDLRNMLVDLNNGRIPAMIISSGNFLGMNDTFSAVPPEALQLNPQHDALLLNVTKPELASYPHFTDSQWSLLNDPAYVASIYQAFHVQPYFTVNNLQSNNQYGVGGTATPTTTGVTSGSSYNDTHYQDRTTRNWVNHGVAKTAKADKIIGMAVHNNLQEKIGKVENMVVDLASGRIIAMIVSSGGFLGIGDTLSAVPPEAFQADPSNNALVLNVTKDLLASYPHFTSGQWPDFNDPQYISSLYQAYHVQPPYYHTAR